MSLSRQLEEATRRRRRRRRASGRVIGPVYRAQPKDFKLPDDRASYWAERPRVAEFGTFVIKAKILLKNPYMGDETSATDVALAMSDADVKRVLDLETEFDPDLYESPHEQFVELLQDQHEMGIWQDRAVMRAIRATDHDGVISQDPHGGETEYIVFSPRQVKVLEQFHGKK